MSGSLIIRQEIQLQNSFSFLRDDDKSVALFEILHSDNTESDKQESVRNESWFKTKWENDPTVVSCLNFLCMLSGKLSSYEDQFDVFWASLNDTSCPAVYFTCLNECDDEYAEIDAAKIYTNECSWKTINEFRKSQSND